MPKPYAVLALLAGVFLAASCVSENEEELYPPPEQSNCLPDTVSFFRDIQPILQTNCLGCHNEANHTFSGAGILLEGYDNVKAYIDANGDRFYNSVAHIGDAEPMPYLQDRIESCSVQKIEAWYNNGYPNN